MCIDCWRKTYGQGNIWETRLFDMYSSDTKDRFKKYTDSKTDGLKAIRLSTEERSKLLRSINNILDD